MQRLKPQGRLDPRQQSERPKQSHLLIGIARVRCHKGEVLPICNNPRQGTPGGQRVKLKVWGSRIFQEKKHDGFWLKWQMSQLFQTIPDLSQTKQICLHGAHHGAHCLHGANIDSLKKLKT